MKGYVWYIKVFHHHYPYHYYYYYYYYYYYSLDERDGLLEVGLFIT